MSSPLPTHAILSYACHARSESQPLDFFTALLSLSGVIGQEGQANYAAVNAFLDAFCHYRRSLSLRACSVDLAVIEDVGYISERSALAAQLDTSVGGINEAQLHKILRYSIFRQIMSDGTAADRSDREFRGGAQIITGFGPQADTSPLLKDARFLALSSKVPDTASSGCRHVPAPMAAL